MAKSPMGGDRTAPDAEWKRIQQKTFTRWCNQSLKTRGMEVVDLQNDFSDGLKLIALLEVLSQKKLGRYNKRPKIPAQKLENVALGLKFIKTEGMKLVNIGNQDIVEGNLKLILGLVWTLIIHYQISTGFDTDEEGQRKKGGSAKQILLEWVQSKIPENDIKNFSTDWNSGIAVAALVDAVAPGLCPEHKDMTMSTPLKNAELAMGRAEEWLDVPQIVSPQDIVNPNIDELSVMTYVSYFRDAKPKEGTPMFAPAKVEVASTVDPEPDGEIVDKVDGPAENLPTFKAFTDEIASVEQAREYTEGGSGEMHVVVGDQTSDLDSMVPVLAHAFLNDLINKSFNQPSSLVVPVFNFPRAELKLSPEAELLFAECNVDLAKITCIDDIDLATLASKGRLKMSIVNHNVLADDQLVLAPSVIEIIDHHDDRTGNLYDSNVSKMIEPVATCTSLIAEFLVSQMPQALERNPDLVQLLLGVILLKTDNMDSSGPGAEKDQEMTDGLTGIGTIDRADLFTKLDALRPHHSAYQLLRKDYLLGPETNVGVTLGCSVVPHSWHDLMSLHDAPEAVPLVSSEEELDFFIVSCLESVDSETKQKFGIYSKDDEIRSRVAETMLSMDALGLSEIQSPENLQHLNSFSKQGHTLSRQELFDLVTAALSEPQVEELPSFKSFVDEIASVQAAKDTAQRKDGTVHVVMGNCACDLDSMASALGRAYYNHVTSKAPASGVVIPMFNTSRRDLPLRTDATKLFEECDVNTANVTCAEDLNLLQLNSDSQLKVTLVDHSVPSEEQKELVPSVVEIVDHHQDDSSGVYDDSVEKTIAPVGSCATLVAEDFLTQKREALEENPDLVKLLLGAILVDTDNLSPTTGLATDKDHDVVIELSKLTESDGLFDELIAAKFDTSGLSAYDLLRQDYKDAPLSSSGSRAGGSTVPENATHFLARGDATKALLQFTSEKATDVFLVNTLYYSYLDQQERQRQIVIYGTDDKLCNKVSKYLANEDILGLKEVPQDSPSLTVFEQTNVRVSRKRILELISAALSQPDEEEIPSFKVFVDQKASVGAAKKLVQEGEGDLNVVIGDQRCDLDSMVSSLARAYFNDLVGRASSGLVVPAFNVPRSDLPLRADAMHLFATCDVNADHVACSGDLDLADLQRDGRLRLTLVDHNVPCDSQQSVITAVTEIVDHHDDTSRSLYGPDVAKRMALVGSCATLVARDFLDQKRIALEKNPDLVKLLLGAILVDTENLAPAAGVVTDQDREVVKELSQFCDVDCNGLYRELRTAGYENAYNLLKDDYKDAPETKSSSQAGGSTVRESLETFLGPKYAREAIESFSTERDIDVFLVDFISYSDQEKKQQHRQLVIYCDDPRVRGQVVDFLRAQSLLALKDLPLDDPRMSGFEQQNESVSRKEVLKLISAALMPTFKLFVDELASVEVAKNYAKSQNGDIYAVMGNQAGDLDSMVSALGRAYFAYLVTPSRGDLVVPVFNFSRGDIPLRVEAVHLFTDCNVNTASVLCDGDIDLKQLQATNRLELTLVDHNVPVGDKEFLRSSVIEIIDHHKDETGNLYHDVTKNIAPVGSCATLVAKDFLDMRPLALERNPDLTKLLLGTILVDTVNLDPSAGRATDVDRDVVVRLGKLTDVDQDSLYGQLQNAKFDLSGLSAYDLLRKDFKNATPTPSGVKVGTSSIPESLDNFLKRPAADDALDRFTKDRDLDLLLLVSVFFTDPEYHHMARQCGVYSKSEPLRSQVANYLKNQESLKLDEMTTSNPNLTAFNQGNVTASRKQLLPLVNAALAQPEQPIEIQRGVESEPTLPIDVDVVREGVPAAAAAASADVEPIPVLTAMEEREEGKHWKTVTVGGKEKLVDMEAIGPYTNVFSHGGYGGHEQRYAVIVFAACHLPDKSIPNYPYVLDNLFYYCLGILESLAADHYMVVYLHGGTADRNVPKFRWMRRCYPMLDRRIRKNMKELVFVHAGFWIRTLIRLMRPFISAKFYRKIHHARTLDDLGQFVDLQQITFPQPVLDWDERVTKGKTAQRSASAEPLTTSSDKGDNVGTDIPEEPEAAAGVTPAEEG